MFDRIFLNLIFFLIVFLIIFLIDNFIITKTKEKNGKKKVKKEKLTSEGQYIISRFNLDEAKVNLKILNFHISIINAFIISFTATTVSNFGTNIVLQLLIGFVMLFLLIYAIYEIYGRHMKKKWGKR